MITIYRTKYDDCLNQPQSICSCVSQIADYPAMYKNCSDLSKFFPTDFVYSTQISYTVNIYMLLCSLYATMLSFVFVFKMESSNKWTFSFELLKFKGSVSVISRVTLRAKIAMSDLQQFSWNLNLIKNVVFPTLKVFILTLEIHFVYKKNTKIN